MILFKQTLQDVENFHEEIAWFETRYDELKEFCREACLGLNLSLYWYI